MTVIDSYEEDPPEPNSKCECAWCKRKVKYKDLRQAWDWSVCQDCFNDLED